jgi:hypothetical protein
VPDQKFIHILWQSQTFCARQKEALIAVKFLDWFKIFGPAQNILGPVKDKALVNVETMRKSFPNFVCFSESPNFIM